MTNLSLKLGKKSIRLINCTCVYQTREIIETMDALFYCELYTSFTKSDAYILRGKRPL